MKKIFFSLIGLLILSNSVATANDSCTADVSGYTPEKLKVRKSIFEIKAQNIKKAHPSKLIQYGFEDKVTLKNGMDVVYIKGGCAHYGFRFVFSGDIVKSVKEVEKLDRAKSLLKMVLLSSDYEKNVLLGAIDDAKKKKSSEWINGELSLPCGDASCQLLDRDDHKVEIGYSFAL